MKDKQMIPTFFTTPSGFRNWLEKNHKTKSELLVGFYKIGSGKASINWSQAVDEALCYGWIDGVRKSIDEHSYQIRFTPRKPTSIWSSVNIKKIEELNKQGRLQPAGLVSFEKRLPAKSMIYSYEKEEATFSKDFNQQFKANKKAWDYFQSLAPSYKKLSTHWVMSAKQESTQIKRLNELIADCVSGTNKWKDNKYNKK
jgi:uncharacterized protein YdeI (YjbR/CyaY-like superfamily)